MPTHYKKLMNPDYLGAYALDPGKDLVVTIRSVANEMIIGADGKKEECIVARFHERDIKPMILNATNCKTITKLAGSPFIENWQGMKIQLFVEKVKAFGDVVEALRIRPFKPKVEEKLEEIPCEECGAILEPYEGRPAKWLSEYTKKQYGKTLCIDCVKKAKENSNA